VAVIDPGPDLESHVRAVHAAVADAESVAILVTHGHADHAAGVAALVERLGADVPVHGAGHALATPLPPEGIATDDGRLVAVATPGHARDHLAFLWPERRALFAGDHLLGQGDTTWVAEYPGCVADYLESLARLRALRLEVVYPGHGPPLHDPEAAIDRFERHRRERIEAVRRVLDRDAALDEGGLYEAVYGDTVPPGLEAAARRSLAAVREYVDTEGGRGLSSAT
jgi:glyoxylase-like metal-dependent hydrolase (beta-lactamase superfamily II)